jgi:hypothetical protein
MKKIILILLIICIVLVSGCTSTESEELISIFSDSKVYEVINYLEPENIIDLERYNKSTMDGLFENEKIKNGFNKMCGKEIISNEYYIYINEDMLFIADANTFNVECDWVSDDYLNEFEEMKQEESNKRLDNSISDGFISFDTDFVKTDTSRGDFYIYINANKPGKRTDSLQDRTIKDESYMNYWRIISCLPRNNEDSLWNRDKYGQLKITISDNEYAKKGYALAYHNDDVRGGTPINFTLFFNDCIDYTQNYKKYSLTDVPIHYFEFNIPKLI